MVRIDVREELGVDNTPRNIFIKAQGPDKTAAALRLATTEMVFERWHADINSTNLRELPAELIEAYDQASIAMCRILMMEREIINCIV